MSTFRLRLPSCGPALMLAVTGTGLVSSSSVAHAATIHVTTTVPDVAADGQCSLFEAVQSAETDAPVDGCAAGSGLSDTIDLPAGTYEILVPASAGVGLPNVTTNIAFHGAGSASTIIQRATSAPVFTLVHVTSASTFQGLTLKGGKSGGANGSAILGQAGVPLTLNDVVVTGSRGTVAWYPAVGTVKNSRFSDNEGALETYFSNVSPLDIEGSTFEDNVASSRGALVLVGPVTLKDSIFRGNGTSSGGGGGAVDSFTNLTVRGCLFEGNQALQGPGGGIYARGTVDIATSAFVDNGAAYGGAIAFEGGKLVNTTFSGNEAVSGGGALHVTGNTTVTINNVTISANQSPQGGGLRTSGTGALLLSNSVLAANTSADGADCFAQGSAVITSGGHNLIGLGCPGFAAGTGDAVGTGTALDARLSALGAHGGATPTHAPLGDSPLIDAGHPGSGGGRPCEATDQVGTARPVGARCDIGAFEGSLDGSGGEEAGAGSDAGGNSGAPGDVAGAPGSGGTAGEGETGGEGRQPRGGGGGNTSTGGASGPTSGGNDDAGADGDGTSRRGSDSGASSDGGCGCREAPSTAPRFAGLALFALGLALRARRQGRSSRG
jgi:predicted outer membrane repeat protein